MDNFRIMDTLNEGNKATKKRRNRAMGRVLSPEDAEQRRKEQHGTRQDELPGHSSRPSNDPGSNVPRVSGYARGRKKVTGSRREIVNPDGTTQTHSTKKGQGHLKDRLMAKHRKDESTMNQENFEAAYIRSNAQIAFTIAEAMTKITAKPAKGHSSRHSTRGQSDQSEVERDSKGRRLIKAKPAVGHDPRYSRKNPGQSS